MIFVQTVTIGAEKIRKQSGSFPYPVRRPLSWSVQEETLQNAGSGADGLMSSAQALRNAEKEPKVMCLTRTAPRFAERRIQRKPQRTFSVRLRTQAQAQTSKRRLYGKRVRRRCVWPFSVLFRAASGSPFFSVLPENDVASGGPFRMRRRRRSAGRISLHRWCICLRRHTFFWLVRKKYAKKRRWGREIALTRRKSIFLLRTIHRSRVP